ncbi:hypothetical protein E1J06_04590 [Phocaeicola dorei]|uniref:Uncharacterized protein n=1 Tax=Phocaeicola dorei TaxID=357276 RepID=A0AAX2R313_9BACT|nr:hypothetical protein E1J06_04590 [Phocaeicola dorei]TDB14181.1 hypothetical protein E1I95_04450 [Phocaeicola dorei]TDB20716.1 hypothetical protein E1I71_07335 [Phocaeicola dorei]
MIRLFHTKIGFYRIYPSGFYVDPVNRHSVEVQTFHVYFLWGKSLKYPTLYQAETIYKKRIYS